MYLHLGYSEVADYGDLIGIFDLDNVSQSHRTREFLEKAQETGTLHTLGERIPSALVVCTKASYLSPISAATLQRRAGEELLENSVTL